MVRGSWDVDSNLDENNTNPVLKEDPCAVRGCARFAANPRMLVGPVKDWTIFPQDRAANADRLTVVYGRGPPPPFLVSVDSKVVSLLRKFIRINTCGQFLEVLILRDLWGDKTRQNTVKRGVWANAENKGVAKFQLEANKKRQLEAGGTKWETNYYFRSIIPHCYFLSSKKEGFVKPRLKCPLFYLD